MAISGLVDAGGVPLVTPKAPTGVRPIIVRDMDGVPVAPSEILAGLKRMHPSLGLRYRAMEWCVTWEWPETDPRWQWVREGKQDPASAYDTVGRLPLDCPLDQAASYIETALRDYPVEDVRKIMGRITHYNRVELPREQIAAAMAGTFDAMGTAVGRNEGFSAGGIGRGPRPKPKKSSKP